MAVKSRNKCFAKKKATFFSLGGIKINAFGTNQ